MRLCGGEILLARCSICGACGPQLHPGTCRRRIVCDMWCVSAVRHGRCAKVIFSYWNRSAIGSHEDPKWELSWFLSEKRESGVKVSAWHPSYILSYSVDVETHPSAGLWGIWNMTDGFYICCINGWSHQLNFFSKSMCLIAGHNKSTLKFSMRFPSFKPADGFCSRWLEGFSRQLLHIHIH